MTAFCEAERRRKPVREAAPAVPVRDGPSGLRRFAAAVAGSAGRAGRPGLPPIAGTRQ
nr:hypothetical protein [uncultured Actinoplanes sp.]